MRPIGVLASALSGVFLLAVPSAGQQDPFAITADLAGQAVFSAATLTLNGNSTVDSVGTSGGSGAGDQGHVVSNSDVVLNGSAKVKGNATCGPGKRVQKNGGASVTGLTGALATARNPVPISLQGLDVQLAAQNDNGRIGKTNKNQSPLQGAGKTDLVLNGNETITIPSGTYFFTQITINGGSQLNLSGLTRILCTGPITINGNSTVNGGGNPSLLRLWTSGRYVTLNGGALKGIVYAPLTTTTIDGGAVLTGTVFSAGVSINGGARVTRSVDDATALAVTVTNGGQALADGSVHRVNVTPVVTVTGGTPPLAATLALDGGAFSSGTVVSSEGTHRLVVVVNDQAGRHLEAAVTFVIDKSAPRLAVVRPSNGGIVAATPIDVYGTSDDAVSVTVNGIAAAPSGGSFVARGIPVVEGANGLAVSGSDLAGNVGTASSSVILDTQPPVLTVSAPAAGTLTKDTTIVVQGNVADPHLATFTVGGAPVALPPGGGPFSVPVPLVEGPNVVLVEGRDVVGHVVSRSIAVERDTVKPVVRIAESGVALEGGRSYNRNLTITVGVVEAHPGTLAVTLDGTSFTSGATVSAEGEHALSATAQDQAGNSEASTVRFTIDKTAPSLAIMAPTPGSTVRSLPQTLEGVSGDAVSVDVNGTGVTPAAGRFAIAAFPFAEGPVTVTATGTDAAGNVGTATATYLVDTEAPGVAILTPVEAAILGAAPIFVTGTATDANLLEVTVNGLPASLGVDGTFRAGPFSPADGPATFTATATDRASRSSSATRNVTVDTVPPEISIRNAATSTPIPADALFNAPIVVAASVTDVTTPARTTHTTTLDGSLYAGSPVANEGSHRVEVVATDGAGNTATATATFTLDTTSPVFSALLPADGAVGRTTPVTVSGQVSADTESVTVAGQVATYAGGAFSRSGVVLTEGPNDVALVATDRAGNHGTRTLRLVLDTTGPAIAIASPAEGALVGSLSVAVSGTATDANLETVTVEGGPASLEPNGTFSRAGVTLAEGPNTLTATAKDKAGNTTSASVRVTADSLPPTVSITAPGSGAVLGQSPVVVSGTATDPHLETVSVNGVAAAVDAAGRFTASLPLAEGSNTLTVTARDTLSHSAHASVIVSLDSAAPSVTITAPQDGTRFRATPQTVRGTVGSAANLESVTVNGVAAVLTDTSYEASVGLLEGTNSLTARARETTGKEGTAKIDVVLDTTAPRFTGSSPSEGQSGVVLVPEIRLTFSEALDPATVVSAAFSLATTGGPAPALAASLGGAGATVVTLVPAAPLLEAHDYTLGVTPTLRDLAGNVISGPVTVRFTTVDQTAPPAPVLEPVPSLLCATTLTLVGTSEPGAIVSVSGGAAGAQGTAGADGRFAVTVPLSPATAQTLSVTARDASGNLSAPATVSVTVDCEAPHVVDVVSSASGLVVTFDEAVLRSTIVEGSTVRLDAAGGTPIPVLALLSAGDRTLTLTAAGIDLSTIGFTLSLSSGVTDLAGNALTPFVRSFEPPSTSTLLLGEVYDDAIGRPLGGATATLLVSGGVETPEPRPYATATAAGAWALPTLSGDALVRVGAPGYLDVFHRDSVVAGGSGSPVSATLFDARLTPVAEPATASATTAGAVFRAAFGKRTVTLDAPTGSLPPGAVVRLTLRRPQGIPVLAPLGWSVAAAVRLSISDVSGASLAAAGAMTLLLPDFFGATSSTPLVLARLDESSLQWLSQGSATLEAGALRASVASVGDWAVFVPDPAPTAPAAPALGAPLPGVGLPAEDPLESAAVVADPVDVLPSQTSDVALTVTSPQPVPSGYPVQVLVTEELTLLDGSRLAGPSFLADLVLLRRGDGTLGLSIPVRASEGARRVALSVGYERFRVEKFPFEVRRGVVVGPSGGTVTGASGWSATLPSGAVSGPTSIALTALGVAELPAGIPEGFDFLAAVKLSTGGVDFGLPVTLTYVTATPPPSGRDILLVTFEDRGGFLIARPVARASYDAASQTLRSNPIDRATFPWPGVRGEGSFAFLLARDPLAFVAGRVLDVDASPLRDTLVSAGAGWTLQAVSESDGTFALAIRAAASTLSAVRVDTGNIGLLTVSPSAPGQEIPGVELRLVPTAPWVAGVTPSAGSTVLVGSRFTVTFSEPVDPLSITPTSLFLVATVAGQPVVVPAATLVDPGGLSVTLIPAGALPGNTPLALGVARTVRDRNGYTLVDAITRQPADFAATYTTEDLTPPDAKPWLVRFGLPTGDPAPTVTITGAPGAVCPGCHVVAYNDTTLATASTDAGSDGSFTLTLTARATDALRVVVEKANGTKQTLPPVPFTDDGGKTVLVGSKGGSWETPDGFRVTVPAAAFAGTASIATERIPQATFQTLVAPPRDVSLVDAFRMDFPNLAASGFDLSFAAPATSITDQFFLAQIVEVLGQKRLMVVDLLERRNGRLVTDRSGNLQSLRQQGYVALVDPMASAVGGVVRVDARLLSVQTLSGPGSQIDDPKSFFDGVFRQGQYAVYNAAVRMATIAGGLAAGATVATSSASDFLFDSNYALDRTWFRLLSPVGTAFDLTLVDRDSGLVLFEGSYAAPTGTGTVVLVDPPSPDKVRPGLLEAGLAHLYRFDAPVAGASSDVARGIAARSVASDESVAVTVTVEGSVVPKGALLRLVNFSRTSGGADTVSTGESTSFTLQGVQRGDALGLVSENMSAPIESSLLVRFDEAMAPLGATWKERVSIENRASSDGSTCPAVGYEVVEKPSAGPGVRELLLVPSRTSASGWIRSGCRYALVVKRQATDLAGNEMANDVRAEFSLPGDEPIATQAAPSPAFVRKVLYHGGLLLTTGEDQTIRVYDARVPGTIGRSCDMQAPSTPPPTPEVCPSGATTPHVPLPGVGRDLAVDRFGRLIVVGGGTADSQGASPGLGFLRLYDFVPTCGSPVGGCGRRLAARGTTVISANVGGDTITYPPQGIPRRIALEEEVQERSWRVDADDNTAQLPPDVGTMVTLELPAPDCDPPASGTATQILKIKKGGAGGRQGYRQRYEITSDALFPASPRCHKRRFFSFTNVATGETVHARTDENGAGLYLRDGTKGVSLRASSGDRIRMIANGVSVAVVDVLGYGLAFVDLDAVYVPDDVAGQSPNPSDPTLASKLLLAYDGSSESTPAGRACADASVSPGTKTCDEPYQRCGTQGACNLRGAVNNVAPAGQPPVYEFLVDDLVALTGIAVRKTETPGLAWGFGSLNGFGLLSFSIDLRATDDSGGARAGMGRERSFAAGSGLATIRAGHMVGLVHALPLKPVGASARANDIVLVEGVKPPARPQFCTAWAPRDDPKDLAFVAAGDNGVYIVDVTDPGRPAELGRFGTRGGALAVSADAARKLLYVSDAGEGMKAFSFEDPCGETPGGTAVDDPRLVAAYSPAAGSLGNTPVSVDPDTGIVYGSETGSGSSVVNGFELAPPPLYAVADTDLDGELEPVEAVIPLGVENASKTAAIGANPLVPVPAEKHGAYVPDHFRVLAFLPGGVGETVDVEVAGTNLRGYDLPPSTSGFPRSGYLPASPSRPDSRPVTLRRSSDDPSDRAFNRYQSDAITVLADPRARIAYERTTYEKGLPGEKGQDNPYSCRNCDVAKDVAASLLSADGKRAELWSGDLIRVRFTEDLRTKLTHLGASGVDLDSSSLVLTSVRGDFVPGLGQTPRESSSVGASDAVGVDLASGEEHLSGSDLRLAGRGLDFALSRAYASQALHDGPLGRSWDSPLLARLRFLPDGDVDLYDGTARRDTFRLAPGGREFVAPPGLFAQLTNAKDGSWYLTHADKTIQRFDADGRLVEIWDAVSRTAQNGGDGNRLRLLHDAAGRLTAVLDTLDHAVTFDFFAESDLGSPGATRAALGRLKKVTDHTGRTVEYRYDDQGRLAKVLLPELKTVALGVGSTFTGESGRPSTTYTYPATPNGDPEAAPRRWLLESDNVRSVSNARSQEVLRLTYRNELGAAADEVVTGQEIGGKPLSITYVSQPDATVRATVTDRRGHDWVVEHTNAGHLASLRLPANDWTDANTVPSVPLPIGPLAPGPTGTGWGYDNAKDGLPSRIEKPGKEVEKLRYQEVPGAVGRRAAANVVESTVTAAAPTGSASREEVLSLTTTASYDAATNSVSTLTLPGGLETKVDYVAGKGLPERVTPPVTYGEKPAPDGTPTPVSRANGFTYDSQARTGQLQSVTDPTNMTWRLGYFDKSDAGYGFVKSLWTVSEPSIRMEFTRRDARGNVLSETNPRGVVTERTVDEYDRVVEERRAVSAAVDDGGPRPWVTIRRAWDPDGNLERETTTDGATGTSKTVRYEWDALGRLVSRIENPETDFTKKTSYEYDSTGNVVVTTDPEGARTAVARDARGLPVAVTRIPAPGRGETPTSTSTFLRDARGNVLEEFDGVNTRTIYRYDGLGRRTQVVSPRGAVTTISYDAASRPSLQTTVDGEGKLLQKAETTYTPAGDVYETRVTVLDAELHESGVTSTRHGYDGKRRPVSMVDPLGRLTNWQYFDAARRFAKTDPAGNVLTTEADENGNPVKVIAEEKTPGGGVERIEERATWDALDRPLTRTDGLGKTTGLHHDGFGRLVETVDPEGVRTTFAHDLSDRVTRKVEDADGLALETKTTYNRWDLVESLTDAREAVRPDPQTRKKTVYTYDGLGRHTRTTWADGTSRSSAYNPDGTVYRTTDERGNVTTFVYGPDDTVERTDVARAAGTPGFTYEQTLYDVLGRPRAVTTDAGLGGAVHTVTKSYDSRGLVLSESLDGVASTHEYDLAGNRLRSAYPSPGRSLVRKFDARDTLRSLAEVVGATGTPLVRATFEPWGIARTGSIVRSTAPSGLATSFAYDLRRLPESMSTRLGEASPSLDLAYAWGDARELISETRGQEGRADVYAYDKVYRMTGAGLGQAPATTPDLDGRIALSLSLGRVSTIDGVTRRLDGMSTSFTNETTPRHRYSLFLGQSHEQDAAGNETRNRRGNFEWDARNRLVRATTQDGTTLEYGYDALGRRVERRQKTLGTTVSARFVYDGFEPVQEWSCTACDTQAPTYSLFREYLSSGSLDRPLELITHAQSGPPEGSRFLLFGNVAGSITLVTDENGRPVERIRYLPQGTPTFDTPVAVRSISSTPTGGLNVELVYGFDPGTVTSQSVHVFGNDGAAITATVTPASDGRTIRITDAAFPEGSQLRLSLTGALADPWGGTNGVDSSASFVYRMGEKLFERQDFALDRTSRVGLSRLWQGLEYEPALGLYYVRHRWYDPETGSFLSADPLGFPDGLNQYTWPYANPWKQDPWGLESGGAFTADNPENRELQRRYMAGEIQRTPEEAAFERATVGVASGATAGAVAGLGAAAAWPSVSAQWSIGSHWMGAKWFVLANAARGNLDRAVEFFSDLLSPDPRATGLAHPERGAWVPGGVRRRPPLPPDLKKYRRATPTDEIRKALNAPVVKVDAAYGTVIEKAEAGHIISADSIMRDPRFLPLNDEQRREVLNVPENFVPLSRRSNASQGTLAPSEWRGHSQMGPLPEENRRELERLEAIAREAVERAFERMLKKE